MTIKRNKKETVIIMPGKIVRIPSGQNEQFWLNVYRDWVDEENEKQRREAAARRHKRRREALARRHK